MRKTFNTQFELINKALDESVTIQYSATFLISPETKSEPEAWELIGHDFEAEYFPKWATKEVIDDKVKDHIFTYLGGKNPNHPMFV